MKEGGRGMEKSGSNPTPSPILIIRRVPFIALESDNSSVVRTDKVKAISSDIAACNDDGLEALVGAGCADGCRGRDTSAMGETGESK